MIRLLGSPWALGALLVAVTASLGAAYWKGSRDTAARYGARIAEATAEIDKELSVAAARLEERDAQLLELRDALARSGEEYDELARLDPGACHITPDGMRRLLGHWGPIPEK